MQVARSPLVGALGALALGFAVMYVWATALALQLSNLDILNKNKWHALMYELVQLWPVLFVVLSGMTLKLGQKYRSLAIVAIVCAFIQFIWMILVFILAFDKTSPIRIILTKLKAKTYDLYDCTGADCKHEIDSFSLNMIKFKTICDIILSVLTLLVIVIGMFTR